MDFPSYHQGRARKPRPSSQVTSETAVSPRGGTVGRWLAPEIDEAHESDTMASMLMHESVPEL